ncbi:MAG: radical SAM protein [Syntrophobacteraceae bacterium]|nr:radical SAM protein [Syntrophobacteraceae bacterium]
MERIKVIMKANLERHPCFNAEAKGSYGRVHLPVAPECNIRCNYCNRKTDCVNESRPGVSSAILTPMQALAYMDKVLEKESRISVAGIAGPGDPFANPTETLETMRLIKEHYPEMLLCLSSNGLAVPRHLEEIAKIGVSHVTITINAVDPQIGAKIYSWVRDGKVIYRGIKGAELLLERQLQAVEGLKKLGVTVKANVIVVPTVNDHHVEEVAKTLAGLGVDLLNCMAMFPNRETVFEDIPEPEAALMEELRAKAEKYLPQMRHCTRCRADAVGLLGNDRSAELCLSLRECAALPRDLAERPHVAVATVEGLLVNLHLGETEKFQIWSKTAEGFRCIDRREAPEPGSGTKRWENLAELLKDCRAVLVAGVGETPRKVLLDSGIEPVEMNGFIEMGLDAVYSGRSAREFKVRKTGGCAKNFGCSGTGEGC